MHSDLSAAVTTEVELPGMEARRGMPRSRSRVEEGWQSDDNKSLWPSDEVSNDNEALFSARCASRSRPREYLE